ncbi:MAG TPA: hypothetical protein VNH53_10800 [Sphingomicrobium sp.]|jgi:hypothetical protein|nr:hypothetical protein [Sphingomicrobium sp.]
MGPGYFVIAILGCADGPAACTQVATMPTRYESATACAAATGDALLNNHDFDYPTIVAECRSGAIPASASEQPLEPRKLPDGSRHG